MPVTYAVVGWGSRGVRYGDDARAPGRNATLFEAELGLGASGTNSGIMHTGFARSS